MTFEERYAAALRQAIARDFRRLNEAQQQKQRQEEEGEYQAQGRHGLKTRIPALLLEEEHAEAGGKAAQRVRPQHRQEGVLPPAEEEDGRHARKEQGAEPQVPPFCLTPQSQKGVGHAAQDRDQGIVKLHSIVPFRKKCPRARRLRGVHHAVPP